MRRILFTLLLMTSMLAKADPLLYQGTPKTKEELCANTNPHDFNKRTQKYSLDFSNPVPVLGCKFEGFYEFYTQTNCGPGHRMVRQIQFEANTEVLMVGCEKDFEPTVHVFDGPAMSWSKVTQKPMTKTVMKDGERVSREVLDQAAFNRLLEQRKHSAPTYEQLIGGQQ